MTTLEIFALIVLLAAAIKIVVILISARTWINFIERVWKVPMMVMLISLVLAGIVLYCLLQTFSIVQIFAMILFVALLSMATMAVYAREFIAMAQKMLKENILKRAWLPVLIWAILIIWGGKELLM